MAWLLLALALALMGADRGPASLPLRLAELFVYLGVMLAIVRPLASWFLRKQRAATMSWEVLGLTLTGVFASAAATQGIGVHPRRISSWSVPATEPAVADFPPRAPQPGCVGGPASALLRVDGHANPP